MPVTTDPPPPSHKRSFPLLGHHLFQPLAAYSQSAGGAVPLDRSDPYHSDPGGEFIRIEAANTGGTVSVSFNILGPGD